MLGCQPADWAKCMASRKHHRSRNGPDHLLVPIYGKGEKKQLYIRISRTTPEWRLVRAVMATTPLSSSTSKPTMNSEDTCTSGRILTPARNLYFDKGWFAGETCKSVRSRTSAGARTQRNVYISKNSQFSNNSRSSNSSHFNLISRSEYIFAHQQKPHTIEDSRTSKTWTLCLKPWHTDLEFGSAQYWS